VLLHVTDIPYLNAAAIVTRQRPESIGFKVVLKGMDWSTMLVDGRAKSRPTRAAGIFSTHGGRRRTSSIRPLTSACRARGRARHHEHSKRRTECGYRSEYR
jgi:hypothetical protein